MRAQYRVVKAFHDRKQFSRCSVDNEFADFVAFKICILMKIQVVIQINPRRVYKITVFCQRVQSEFYQQVLLVQQQCVDFMKRVSKLPCRVSNILWFKETRPQDQNGCQVVWFAIFKSGDGPLAVHYFLIFRLILHISNYF